MDVTGGRAAEGIPIGEEMGVGELSGALGLAKLGSTGGNPCTKDCCASGSRSDPGILLVCEPAGISYRLGYTCTKLAKLT